MIGALHQPVRTTTGRRTASTPAWTTRTSTSRGRGSGCCSAGRWRSTGPATAPAARRAAPRRSCCWARRCCGGRSCRRWRRWPGSASPGGTGGPARSCSCVAAGLLPWFYFALRRPDDVLLLRRCRRCRSWSWPWSTCWARSSPPAGADVGAAPALAPGERATTAGWSAASWPAAYVLLVALCFAYFYPIFVGPAACRTRTGRPGCGWTAAGSDQRPARAGAPLPANRAASRPESSLGALTQSETGPHAVAWGPFDVDARPDRLPRGKRAIGARMKSLTTAHHRHNGSTWVRFPTDGDRADPPPPAVDRG